MNTTTSPQPRMQQDSSDEIDLGRLWNVLQINRAWIALALLAGLCVSGLYALSAAPVYQADALIQIESGNKSSILGDLQSLAGGGGSNADASTEMQIMKSRLVLGSAVDALTLTARPHYQAPFFLKRLLSNKRVQEPMVQISQFVVPDAYLGEKFVLEFQDVEHYSITAPWGQTYQGTVGNVLTTPEGLVSLVLAAQVEPGDAFRIAPQSRQQAITELSKAFAVAESGRKTNVLRLSLTDTEPAFAQRALDSVLGFYVQQNREYDAQVASFSLEFIDQQLPQIKEKLEKAENALNVYRNRNVSVDVAAESKGLVEALNQLDMQLTELKAKEGEIQQMYMPEHPVYKALAQKRAVLEKAKKQIMAKISAMPATQQDIIRLRRDVEIQQAIYQQLLQKQQELGITQASKMGNIRVIDGAMTLEKPIKPKRVLIVAVGTLGAGILAAVFFLGRMLMRRGIEEGSDVEQLGLSVLATVPLSEVQRKRDMVLKYMKKRQGQQGRSNHLLALHKSDDIAIEALRALRTSLYVHALEASHNIVVVTGATPAVGKTFVSANLATVVAQEGKKVLLVDADMRKGYMHELLGVPSGSAGLGDYLTSSEEGELAIYETPIQGLDFIPQGRSSSNPAEALASARLEALLAKAGREYDYVILDAPPALAVADASIIARHAGITVLVARFGETTLADLDAALTRLQAHKVRVTGVVLNGVTRTASNYHTYEAYTRYTQST